MNELLRNKWVVGLLALAAVALLAMQFWPTRSGPRPGGPRASLTEPAAPAIATPNPPGTAAPTATTNAVAAMTAPERSADRVLLAERWEAWRDMVGRDPFEGPASGPTNGTNIVVYATNLLSLTGLWLQTGSRLAVVNNAIVAEDDAILDYTIESIGFDHIWVFGQRGREQVPFGQKVLPRTATAGTGPSNPGRSPASPTRP